MLKEKHIEFMGYEVFAGELNKAFSSEKMIINTINQYSYCIEENDLEFKEALSQSDILLPDMLFVGMTGPKQEKWIKFLGRE